MKTNIYRMVFCLLTLVSGVARAAPETPTLPGHELVGTSLQVGADGAYHVLMISKKPSGEAGKSLPADATDNVVERLLLNAEG